MFPKNQSTPCVSALFLCSKHKKICTFGFFFVPLRPNFDANNDNIDSTLKRQPDGRLAQRLSPRQKRSHWTELHKQRCADLESRGLMTDLGRAALQIANKYKKL